MKRDGAAMTTHDDRRETPAERADRNLAELLQELRVAGLGIQVLFGFLLAMPFSQGFTRLGHAQRQLYIGCLLLAAVATVLLVGPVAYHRLVFRQRQKERLVRAANLMVISGLVAVGLAISSSVLLVVSFVESGPAVVLIPVLLLFMLAGLWFAVPLNRRRAAAASHGRAARPR
jgi:Family of unknown function (DUF6328)